MDGAAALTKEVYRVGGMERARILRPSQVGYRVITSVESIGDVEREDSFTRFMFDVFTAGIDRLCIGLQALVHSTARERLASTRSSTTIQSGVPRAPSARNPQVEVLSIVKESSQDLKSEGGRSSV